MSMKKAGFVAGLSFLAGAIFFALSFGYLHKSGDRPAAIGPDVAEAQSVPTALPAGNTSFVPVVKKVRPAVVRVVSEVMVESGGSPFGDDFFGQFFNMPHQRQKQTGMGTGFYISADGYILTNNHVVADAVTVRVYNIDKEEFKAKVVGTDPKTDLALLKVNVKNVPFIELGDSNAAEVGEWVLAIGNPLEQDQTVTAGIISAKGRQLGLAQYEDFLQTDAAINRGNSGGPLVNMRGQAIGINSSILSPTGGNIGIGFAIPSDMAKKVISDLKSKGRVVRGWLGISMPSQPITEGDAKELGLAHGGVIIAKVEEDSPAAKAGLKRYDLITAINGRVVKESSDVMMEIANTAPGDTVTMDYYRGQEKNHVSLKVGEAPDSVNVQSREEGRNMDLGMTMVKNSQALARQYELKTSQGLLVQQVERDGAAAENGLQPGDIILAINRAELDSVEQFRSVIARKKPGESIFLLINRDGNESFIKFRLPE
jgi:serine protease Do